jgi:hypothetical protein
MTPDEYRATLEAIGWTEHGLSRQLGVAEQRTRRWGQDGEKYPIPKWAEDWLNLLADFHRAHPPPARPDYPRGITRPAPWLEE